MRILTPLQQTGRITVTQDLILKKIGRDHFEYMNKTSPQVTKQTTFPKGDSSVALSRAFFLLVLVAGFASMTAMSSAAVIFSDNFTGVSNLNTAGWYSSNTSASATAWTGVIPTSPAPSSPLTGTVMRNNASTQQNTTVTKQWTPVSLVNVGDSITVTLDFQTTTSPTSSTLQLSLFDTAYTFTGNVIGSSNPVTDADGYRYQQTWNSTNTGYRELVDNTSTSLTSATGSISINNNSGHTLVFSLTRTASGIEISSSLDNVAFASYVDTTPATYTYNSISLFTGQAAYFDNISVSTTVPEPSVSLLLGAAAGMVLFFRRRRSA